MGDFENYSPSCWILCVYTKRISARFIDGKKVKLIFAEALFYSCRNRGWNAREKGWEIKNEEWSVEYHHGHQRHLSKVMRMLRSAWTLKSIFIVPHTLTRAYRRWRVDGLLDHRQNRLLSHRTRHTWHYFWRREQLLHAAIYANRPIEKSRAIFHVMGTAIHRRPIYSTARSPYKVCNLNSKCSTLRNSIKNAKKEKNWNWLVFEVRLCRHRLARNVRCDFSVHYLLVVDDDVLVRK